METDEKGVLMEASMEAVWKGTQSSWGYANDFVRRGCRAIAQAQHDHDVAVVKGVFAALPSFAGPSALQRIILVALKAKADG